MTVTGTPPTAKSVNRPRQLANALRRLGITGDQRVATFMWNNAEHLAAYLAVPSMGAVLHTLNIRLFPEQIAYVANEAEDQVVLVDMSLAKLLAPVLPDLETVHTVIAVGEGDTGAAAGVGQDRAALRRGDRRRVDRIRLAGDRREVRGRNVLHQRHHRQPQRRGLQPPFELPAHHGGVYHQRHRGGVQRQGAADRADVSRQRVGAAVCGVDGGRRLGVTRSPSRRPIADRHGRKTCGPRWPAPCRPSGTTSCITSRKTPTTTCRRCGWWPAAARPFRCR